jgi:hypothetical protein
MRQKTLRRIGAFDSRKAKSRAIDEALDLLETALKPSVSNAAFVELLPPSVDGAPSGGIVLL